MSTIVKHTAKDIAYVAIFPSEETDAIYLRIAATLYVNKDILPGLNIVV